MAAVTLQQAKDRLRLDEGIPTADLAGTLAAAEAYISQGIGRLLSAENPLDVEAVLMLVTAWHTCPDGSAEMQTAAARALAAAIKQLKYASTLPLSPLEEASL